MHSYESRALVCQLHMEAGASKCMAQLSKGVLQGAAAARSLRHVPPSHNLHLAT
jgi:hypothetical protein